ncbi:MAG: metal-sensitive transcriptional regulator [Armatimonadetes bacterium]|nr:metal-sensitive transcriptional regulator [Armatimonadota bacterium]
MPAAGEACNQALLRRLRRVEGQVRGLQRMIAQQRGCEEVMTQLAAATTALKQTAARVVSEHYAICFREALASGQDPATVNQRLLNILF